MICPYCKKDNVRVIDTREIKGGLEIRRRRECFSCGARFTTYERLEEKPILVVKKRGEREPYDREKIAKGIMKACEKRRISARDIENIIDKIETKIYDFNKKEVKSIYIGELIMKELKKLDKVAYVRFASVYRDFKDIKEFERELKNLKKSSKGK